MQFRQQAVGQSARLVESATSTVSVVSSAIPIEIVSVPRPRLGKNKHGGVRLSNLTRIKTSSIPVIIERDRDTSHLKIGLLNVRSLTSFFELLVMKSMQPNQSLFIATVYRPTGPYTAFLTEFPEYLSDHVSYDRYKYSNCW